MKTFCKSASFFQNFVKYYIDNYLHIRHVAKTQAAYFKSTMGNHKSKLFKFVMCEFMNVKTVWFNFWLTNKFLSGKFVNYGPDVLNYLSSTEEEKKYMTNPMCNAFPTIVSYQKQNLL